MSPSLSRDDFEVAIICALQLESDAVELVLDPGDATDYGRARGDFNVYKFVKVGNHSIVLLCLSKMGSVPAASAGASLRSSFPHLSLVLITGICGGANPGLGTAHDILLGDVIVSSSVVQYDFGRLYPDGYQIKDGLKDRLGEPPKRVRNLLAAISGGEAKYKLEKETVAFLENRMQKRSASEGYAYPGASHDRLFKASYVHKHHLPFSDCDTCRQGTDSVCAEARGLSCDNLHCEEEHLEFRQRLAEKKELEQGADTARAQKPKIFFGAIASASTVLKDGQERDRLAEKLSRPDAPILAFEMEGAGVWDDLPCLVVKGVCDYADSHKNKKWQNFAAATAAAATRAIIERYPKTDSRSATSASEGEQVDKKAQNNAFNFNGPVTSKNTLNQNFQGGRHTFTIS